MRWFRAQFVGTVARDADFTETDLIGAAVEGADFHGTNFTGSAYLSYGVCPDESCSHVVWQAVD